MVTAWRDICPGPLVSGPLALSWGLNPRMEEVRPRPLGSCCSLGPQRGACHQRGGVATVGSGLCAPSAMWLGVQVAVPPWHVQPAVVVRGTHTSGSPSSAPASG